jgi:Cu(I)/Ag(I) efflux system membrane fusion protein
VATEQEYLLALQTGDQVQGSQIADARERADQLVAAAKQRLLLWELPPDELRTLEDTRRVADAVTFRSPVSGVVVEKQALKGLHVVPGQMLYRVADLSTVWVEADVYERDVADLHRGATATVRVDAYPGEPFTGRVLYIYPYLDEKTRTNRVRFAFANRAGRLKPGMFATVELKGCRGMALTVPMNAVLDSGEEQIVLLAQGNGVYQPRRVKVGRRAGESIEILEGLTAGEQVAEGAAFFLDSESQLRASLQAYEAAPPPAGTAPAAGARISLRTHPEPAVVGENHFEATVTDASGRPIVDATVTMEASMPGMPSMNMPAMRTQTQLTPAGDGVYRGAAHLMSAGRWDTTIVVVKDGEEIGRRSAPLTVR